MRAADSIQQQAEAALSTYSRPSTAMRPLTALRSIVGVTTPEGLLEHEHQELMRFVSQCNEIINSLCSVAYVHASFLTRAYESPSLVSAVRELFRSERKLLSWEIARVNRVIESQLSPSSEDRVDIMTIEHDQDNATVVAVTPSPRHRTDQDDADVDDVHPRDNQNAPIGAAKSASTRKTAATRLRSRLLVSRIVGDD